MEKPLRMTKENTSSRLNDDAAPFPLTQEATGSEQRDICRICQLLIGDVEGHSSPAFVADASS